MVDRRSALNRLAFGSAIAAALGTAGRGEAAALEAAAQSSNDDLGPVVRAIQGVQGEIARRTDFWEIAPVRDELRTFLRTNGKFPDYIEVGYDVWQRVYDWHIRFNQPLAVSRTVDARYTIVLMQTTVILRTDAAAGFIGIPYDNR
jgi:hypothetical protein